MSAIGSIDAFADYLESAEATWCLTNDSDGCPAFWEISLDPDPVRPSAISKQLVSRISSHAIKDSHAIAGYLFLLLRSEISGVHGGMLWPEVARTIEKHADTTLENKEVADFFRSILLREFGHELNEMPGNKYLALCFDQAGVGFERTRLIQSFFTQLLQAHQPRGMQRKTHLLDFLDRFETANKHDHVEQLHYVLFKSGEVLLNLTEMFRNGEAGAFALEWDWDALRQLYRQSHSFDLARLMPEARAVFESIYPSLQGVVTRTGLHEALNSGRISVTFPEEWKPASSRHARDLPLCTVKINRGGIQRDTEVIDDSGVGAEYLTSLPHNQWETGDELCIYTSDKPFAVIVDFYRRESCFSVFTGSFDNHKRRAIYAWISSGRPAHLRVDVTDDAVTLRDQSRLVLKFHYEIQGDNVAARVQRVSARLPEACAELVLMLGETALWSTELDHRDTEWVSFDVRLSIDMEGYLSSGLELSVFDRSTGLPPASSRIDALTDFQCLVTDRGRVVSCLSGETVNVRLYPKSEIHLFVQKPLKLEVPENIVKEKLPSFHSSFEGFAISGVDGGGLDGCVVSLSDGSELIFGQMPALLPVRAASLEVDNVRLVTNGNVIVCRDTAELEISLTNLGDRELTWLSIDTPAGEQILGIAQLSSYLKPDKGAAGFFRLALGEYFVAKNVRLQAGASKITLFNSGIEADSIFVFHVGEFRSLPVRVGELSSLVVASSESAFEYKSDYPLTAENLHKKARSTLMLTSTTVIELSWEPALVDALVRTSSGYLDPDEPLTVSSLDNSAHLCFFGLEVNPQIILDESPAFSVAREESLPLSSLLAERKFSFTPKLRVFANDETLRTFRFDALLDLSVSGARFSEDGSLLQIDQVNVRSVIEAVVHLHVSNKERLESTSFDVDLTKDESLYSSTLPNFQIHLPSGFLVAKDSNEQEMTLTATCSGSTAVSVHFLAHRAPIRVELPAIELGSITEKIRELVNECREAPSRRQIFDVLRLFDAALAGDAHFVLDAERVGSILAAGDLSSALHPAIDSFHLLKCIHSGESSNRHLSMPAKFDRLEILYTSLLLINQSILQRLGLSNPDVARRLMQHLRTAGEKSGDAAVRIWCGHALSKTVGRFESPALPGFADWIVAASEEQYFLKCFDEHF